MGVATMSAGPTERLLHRARDWAGDVEELSTLQWRLFQLECRELQSALRVSCWLVAASVALASIGAPLAIVAALVMLAQRMNWPIAEVLTAAGVAFVALASALWFLARRSWTVDNWFPRSRRQARQNLRGIFAQWSTGDARDEDAEPEYYPD